MENSPLRDLDLTAVYEKEFYVAQILGSSRSASAVVPQVLKLLPWVKSVVDVGCGAGTWLNQFRSHGVPRILGLDGGAPPDELLHIRKEEFLRRDLTAPFALDEKFDLAMSLEVAEHLPESAAAGFVAHLTKLSDVILFGAAIPQQGGTNHINERWPSYWIPFFKAQGYACFDVLRGDLWDDERLEWWYAQNTFLYVKESRSDLAVHLAGKRRAPVDLVHPRCFAVYRKGFDQVEALGETLKTTHAELAHVRAELARAEETTANLKQRLAHTTQERDERDAQIRYNAQVMAKLTASANDAEARFQAVVRSTSWTLTGPLRVAGRRLPALVRFWRRLFPAVQGGLYAILGRPVPFAPDPAQPGTAAIKKGGTPPETFSDPRAAIAGGAATASAVVPAAASADPVMLQRFADMLAAGSHDVVFIAADMVPMHDKHAGGLRLRNLIQVLQDMKVPVVFGSLVSREDFDYRAGSPEDRRRYEEGLAAIGVQFIAYGPDEMEACLARVGPKLRAALLSMPAVAEHLIPRVRLHAPWARILYDMVDFHALRMEREAEVNGDAALKDQAATMRRIELCNAQTADVTIAVSEHEQRLLHEMDSTLAVQIIPTIFELPDIELGDPGKRSGLMFVGGFWHTPNVDAVVWFVNEVWPLIYREQPDLTVTIAGSNATEAVLALNGRPGVEIAGFVPSLRKLLDERRVSIAPLRYGAGVKGKIGEAMAHGVPVVTTTIGAEGMHLRDGVEVLVADEPQAFADAVLRLVRDDALWTTLQRNGRAFVEETQSMAFARKKMEELVHG